jgi:spore coat protein CotF
MTSLTDKEFVNVLLDEHKLSISSYSTLIIESVNQYLRDDITKILVKTFDHQKKIFDLMEQKGWYSVENASQQDVAKAQQQISNIQMARM